MWVGQIIELGKEEGKLGLGDWRIRDIRGKNWEIRKEIIEGEINIHSYSWPEINGMK